MKSSEEVYAEASQLYQKWIIQIRANRLSKPLYLFWGTDLTAGDTDKFLVNDAAELVGATGIAQLFQYMKTNRELVIDPMRSLTWLAAVEQLDGLQGEVFDFQAIEEFIHGKGLNKQLIQKLIDFINLYGDFADQIEEKAMLELLKQREIKALWDFGYEEIFWKELSSGKEVSAVSLPKLAIDHDALRVAMDKLLAVFFNRIATV